MFTSTSHAVLSFYNTHQEGLLNTHNYVVVYGYADSEIQ